MHGSDDGVYAGECSVREYINNVEALIALCTRAATGSDEIILVSEVTWVELKSLWV